MNLKDTKWTYHRKANHSTWLSHSSRLNQHQFPSHRTFQSN